MTTTDQQPPPDFPHPERVKRAMADYEAGWWRTPQQIIMEIQQQLLASALAGGIPERLAYADFLEPRGNPLCELIRLTCTSAAGEKAEAQLAKDIAALRPVIFAPLLAAIDAAWEKCEECRGRGWTDRSGHPGQPDIHDCRDCQGIGRVGKLWRKCGECGVDGKSIPQELKCHWKPKPHIESVSCACCDGTGVLLQVPCPRCGGGHPEFCSGACHGTGYIPSPLLPLWQVAALCYMPEADAIRRGDAKTILEMLETAE